MDLLRPGQAGRIHPRDRQPDPHRYGALQRPPGRSRLPPQPGRPHDGPDRGRRARDAREQGRPFRRGRGQLLERRHRSGGNLFDLRRRRDRRHGLRRRLGIHRGPGRALLRRRRLRRHRNRHRQRWGRDGDLRHQRRQRLYLRPGRDPLNPAGGHLERHRRPDDHPPLRGRRPGGAHPPGARGGRAVVPPQPFRAGRPSGEHPLPRSQDLRRRHHAGDGRQRSPRGPAGDHGGLVGLLHGLRRCGATAWSCR